MSQIIISLRQKMVMLSFLCLMIAGCTSEESLPLIYDVTTIAGGAEEGYADGSGSSAMFSYPTGLSIDKKGNLYVADVMNDRIRKVTPDGQVSTFAGSGVEGHVDGPAATAQFLHPRAVTVDAAGNLYVADKYYIRKITPDGMVSTLAGSGQRGYQDGPAATAGFFYAFWLTVDTKGNVYVIDRNRVIRKISADGMVSTVAGRFDEEGFVDGPVATASFTYLSGITVNNRGDLYVTDHSTIRKISAEGVVSTIAGSEKAGYAEGEGANAAFYNPNGIAVDDRGNVYVVDTGNYRIRMVSPSGVVTTFAGSGIAGYEDGTATKARFHAPYAIVINQRWLGVSSPSLYVSDLGNHSIRKISSE